MWGMGKGERRRDEERSRDTQPKATGWPPCLEPAPSMSSWEKRTPLTGAATSLLEGAWGVQVPPGSKQMGKKSLPLWVISGDTFWVHYAPQRRTKIRANSISHLKHLYFHHVILTVYFQSTVSFYVPWLLCDAPASVQAWPGAKKVWVLVRGKAT